MNHPLPATPATERALAAYRAIRHFFEKEDRLPNCGELAQPPHFRTGSVPPAPPNPVERAALVALDHARNDRSQPKSRKAIG